MNEEIFVISARCTNWEKVNFNQMILLSVSATDEVDAKKQFKMWAFRNKRGWVFHQIIILKLSLLAENITKELDLPIDDCGMTYELYEDDEWWEFMEKMWRV